MTLTTSHNWIAYTASAAQTVFPYTFLIPASTDLQVYVDTVLQASGYTVSGVGVGSGGNVTFATGLVGGEVVLLIRATDDTQQVDLLEGGNLPADSVEGIFDKVYAALQDVRETATRAFGLPVSRAGDAAVMPDLDDSGTWGKALKVNAAGDGLDVFTVLATDIASPITSLGDLIQGGTGGVPERLPIGTAGQVATVAAGQVAWATLPAVLSTLIDAKGDLIVGTAADTSARKAVGTPGSALLADPASSDGLLWMLGAALHGRVRLQYNSATQIALMPRDGHTLYVKNADGWRLRSVGAGITAANTSVYVNGVAAQNLAADTTYLVTLMDDGSLVANFLTALAHSADADTGVEIATGNPLLTVIGLVRTNASSQFADSDAHRGVRSWFHDTGVAARRALTADRTSVSVFSTFAKLDAELDILVLTWATEIVMAFGSGFASHGTDDREVMTGIGIDSTTVPEVGIVRSEVVDAADPVSMTVTAIRGRGATTEGAHTVTILAAVETAGTGTWEGTTSPAQYTLHVLTLR